MKIDKTYLQLDYWVWEYFLFTRRSLVQGENDEI